MQARELELTGFVNARDTGGLPLTTGGSTRSDVLLRADLPTHPDLAELHEVLAPIVGQIVDLRDDVELAATPSPFTVVGVPVVRVPVFEGSAANVVADDTTLADLYQVLVRTRGPAFAQVASVVADGSKGTLVHCTAGKDRTGLAIALILTSVGVRRDAVVADYAATGPNLAGAWLDRRVRELSSWHGRDLTGSTELLAGSPPSALELVLDQVTTDWGSAAGYLRAHGLSATGLDRLRARLTLSAGR